MAKKFKQNKIEKTAMKSHTMKHSEVKGKMKSIFGFHLSDLSDWQSFVFLMNRPCDPSSLAVWRFMFGE